MPIGVPGDELIDEVCWYFPELKFVMRHGAEPWADAGGQAACSSGRTSTTRPRAFAPRYYPQAIIDFANTRGADKVMYAGYFPMGLSPRAHLPRAARTCPFKDEVWPKFLRENAMRVFKLLTP